MKKSGLLNDFANFLQKSGKSRSTIIAYQKDIEQLSETNTLKDLLEFNESDVRHAIDYFVNVKGHTKKTASRKLNSIRTFYKFAHTSGLIKANPAKNVQHPKFIQDKQRILKPTEYLALKEVCRENNRLYTMIELLLQTGMRIGELSRLERKDVQTSNSSANIHICKFEGIKERDIDLNDKARYCLLNYLVNYDRITTNSPLFATKNGTKVQIRNIRNSIDIALNKAKVKNVSVNDLRNTFIVHQLCNGVSISKVAGYVGHKNEVTTLRYLKLLKKKYKPSGIDRIVEL